MGIQLPSQTRCDQLTLDVETANKELDNFEVNLLDKNEKIKELIASANHAFSTISLEGVDLRIKKYMPKKIRHRMLKLAKKYEDVERIDEAEDELYALVASMCIDDPFNKKESWLYLDNETGCIQEVVIKIANEVSKTDKDIKSFR